MKEHKISKKFIAFLLSIVIFTSFSVTPAFSLEAGESRESKAEVSAQAALQYGKAVSLRYALVEDGEVTISGSSGVFSRSENTPPTEDTLYGVGSVSKIYTTVAVMKLVEMGKISLDDAVVKHIPDFKMVDERYKNITIRMLLNHSSGLMGSTHSNSFLLDDKDRTAINNFLENISKQRLKADPGAYSSYCNDGFTLAEILVERVSGISFTDFLHEYITTPLELKNTFTPQDDMNTEHIAKTYAADSVKPLPNETLGIIGTGGIYSTAEDLALFGSSLTLTDNSILSTQSIETMATPVQEGKWQMKEMDDSSKFGLGWDDVKYFPFSESGITAVVKGGDTNSFHTALVVLPEHNLCAAVVSSGGSSAFNQLLATRMLIDALAEKGITVDENFVALSAAAPAKIPESELSNSGYYASSLLVLNATVTDDGIATLKIPAIPGLTEQEVIQKFSFCDDGTYRDESGYYMLKFVKEENGNTYIWQKATVPVGGLGEVISTNYVYEKLHENYVDENTLKSWRSRKDKKYFILNEKYTSLAHLVMQASTIPLEEDLQGYFTNNKIIDKNNSVSNIQIPGSSGRDLRDVTFYMKDGFEYLEVNGSILIESEAFSEIYSGGNSYCTILEDGYSRWLKTGTSAGMTMTVDLPEKGGFFVYDSNGKLIAGSYIYNDNNVILPENGWILFAGDPYQRFNIKLQHTK